MGYREAILADNPTHCWPLIESAGTVAEDIGQNVVAKAATYFNSPVLSIPGKLVRQSRSPQWDGSTTFAEATAMTAFAPGSAFTCEAWMLTLSLSTLQMMIGYDVPSGVRSFQYRMETSGKVSLISFPGPQTITTTSAVPGDGRAHHLCCTYDGTNTVHYIDSVLDSTSTAQSGGMTQGGTEIVLAGFDNGTVTFVVNGYLSWVAMYQSTLSAARVRQHYLAGIDRGYGQGWYKPLPGGRHGARR